MTHKKYKKHERWKEYDGKVNIEGKPHGDGNMEFVNGDKYIGRWKDGKAHGQGKFYQVDGTCGNGEWRENMMHGKGVSTYSDGTIYDGEWQMGKKHGRGNFRIPGRSIYEGDWINDKKHGRGTIKFITTNGKNGKLSLIGEWEEDKFSSGTVISCTIGMEEIDRLEKKYSKIEFIELTKDTKNKINQIIKQMRDSNNQVLQMYGELILNGDKRKIKKFKIEPNVEIRSYAVKPYPSTEEPTDEILSPMISFNPFVTIMENDEQIAGRLAHEAAHVKYGHLDHKHHLDKDGFVKDYNLENIADDLIINEKLKQAGIKLENVLFLDDNSTLVSKRSWRGLILDVWGREILENDLTEERIYETLKKKRNEFRWSFA